MSKRYGPEAADHWRDDQEAEAAMAGITMDEQLAPHKRHQLSRAPIKTAPKDGSEVMLYHGLSATKGCVGWWKSGWELWVCHESPACKNENGPLIVLGGVTHWEHLAACATDQMKTG